MRKETTHITLMSLLNKGAIVVYVLGTRHMQNLRYIEHS